AFLYTEPHLRHVELDVLIPKKMREKARERCTEQVEAFTHCCKETGLLMVFKCREENTALKECLIKHFTDPEVFEMCKKEYLQEKEEFQRTGIRLKKRKEMLSKST
ncbi:hypothetical protein DNTS_004489, partial [Danionella cerebrum]